MEKDLAFAVKTLENGGFTLVLAKGEAVYTSRERGIKPLLSVFDRGERYNGYCAADRVVGNGAAYLYVLLGVKSVYAAVISKAAKLTLEKFGIALYFGQLCDFIINRTGDGVCPIEQAVSDCATPQQALSSIRERLKELAKKP